METTPLTSAKNDDHAWLLSLSSDVDPNEVMARSLEAPGTDEPLPGWSVEP